MLCFAKKVWERPKENADRFRNGLAYELHCLKAYRIVHGRSHEITKEPLTSSNYENTTDKKEIMLLIRQSEILL